MELKMYDRFPKAIINYQCTLEIKENDDYGSVDTSNIKIIKGDECYVLAILWTNDTEDIGYTGNVYACYLPKFQEVTTIHEMWLDFI